MEMEISAHEVRCPAHAAAGHGLVTGPGWFRHHQHRLGRTGVGVGEPVLRLLRRDDPSHRANRSVKVQVSRTPEEGSCQSVAPVTVEPGTRVLRPAGLSSAERISDSPRVWELRGLDATTPVAFRTAYSWEQINGFVTQRVDDASSGLCLSFMGPNPVRNGSLVMSAGSPGPDVYWPWRPGSEAPSQ